jgi:signal transduction histidine kinase
VEENSNIDTSPGEETEDFLDLIETFQSHSSFGTKRVYSALGGLDVFLKFPNAICSALFELNQEEFSFEHKLTSPIEFEEDSVQQFQDLTDSTVIGKSIQTSSIILYPEYTEKVKKYTVVIPLVGQTGVEGIVLIGLSDHWQENAEKFKKLCTLQSGYLKFMLENTRLKNKLDNSKSEMEQRVSSRIMEITQSKREISAILDSVQTGLIISNADNGKILRVNPVAEDWIGIMESDLLGKNIDTYLEAKNQISGAHFESILYDKDGNKTPILRKNVISDISEINYKVESFSDITELKEAQKILENTNEVLEEKVKERTSELEQTIVKLKNEMSEREKAEHFAEEQKELNELKSRFMGMVSHEFRSPLTIIRSGAELMQHYRGRFSDEEMETYLSRIVTTVDYMTLVLQNILFFNNASESVVGTNLIEYNVLDLLSNVVEQVQKNSPAKREIIVKTQENEIASLISPDILRLVFHNLIENAVKFSSSDSSVIVGIEEEETEIYFKVEDSGVGFPEEDSERIFEIFYRGKNADNKTGVGIGLATVKQSITFLHGSIDVKTEIDKGSTFSVIIPKISQQEDSSADEELDYSAIYDND